MDPGSAASFGEVLRAQRERAGLSQSALARRAGLDPSFVNRLESGQRSADRPVVEALIEALGLGPDEGDRLRAAGGYLPAMFARLGLQDPTLQLVARVLTEERLAEDDRAAFRQAVELIGRRWGAAER